MTTPLSPYKPTLGTIPSVDGLGEDTFYRWQNLVYKYLKSATNIISGSSDYNASIYDNYIFVDCSTGNKTLTLPDPETVPGKIYRVFKSDDSTNTLTIRPYAGLIDPGFSGGPPAVRAGPMASSLVLTSSAAYSATNWNDSSSDGRNATPQGTAALSSAQTKFGASSALFDRTASCRARFNGVALTDFTIEAWFYPTFSGAAQDIIGIGLSGGGSQTALILDSSGKLAGFIPAVALTGGTTVSLNTWHHGAITRTGTTVRLFLDGALEATAVYGTAITSDFGYIGDDLTDTRRYAGYIDEVRMSDTARYTAAFSVPTSRFTSDSNTRLLLHFDNAATGGYKYKTVTLGSFGSYGWMIMYYEDGYIEASYLGDPPGETAT